MVSGQGFFIKVKACCSEILKPNSCEGDLWDIWMSIVCIPKRNFQLCVTLCGMQVHVSSNPLDWLAKITWSLHCVGPCRTLNHHFIILSPISTLVQIREVRTICAIVYSVVTACTNFAYMKFASIVVVLLLPGYQIFWWWKHASWALILLQKRLH